MRNYIMVAWMENKGSSRKKCTDFLIKGNYLPGGNEAILSPGHP